MEDPKKSIFTNEPSKSLKIGRTPGGNPGFHPLALPIRPKWLRLFESLQTRLGQSADFPVTAPAILFLAINLFISLTLGL